MFSTACNRYFRGKFYSSGFRIPSIHLRSLMRGAQCQSNAKLKGKTAIVTGGNGGMGVVIAQDLADRGARVILACRNKEKGEEEAKLIQKRCRNINVYALELNLESFKSIKSFVEEFKKKEKELHILINNAGVMAVPFKMTEDGFESHFQINYLGPYYLTFLLLDMLKNSAPSRIINTGAVAYQIGTMNFEDINHEKEYDASNAYPQSKLAVLLGTLSLTKELEGSNVTVNCVHPGVVNTENHRHMGYRANSFLSFSLTPVTWFFMKTAQDGAQTTIHCAVAEELERISGKYFAECKETAIEGDLESTAAILHEKTKEWISKLD